MAELPSFGSKSLVSIEYANKITYEVKAHEEFKQYSKSEQKIYKSIQIYELIYSLGDTVAYYVYFVIIETDVPHLLKLKLMIIK